jgi:hypothetical protein
MTVGLPGSGVGGIFYLVSSLCMPLVALARRLRSREVSWRLVAAQFGLAAGIMGGLWLTGWMLALVLARTPVARLAARASADAGRIPNLLHAGSILVAVGTMVAVVITVWIAALVVHGPAALRGAPRPQETPPESAPPPIARVSSAG